MVEVDGAALKEMRTLGFERSPSLPNFVFSNMKKLDGWFSGA